MIAVALKNFLFLLSFVSVRWLPCTILCCNYRRKKPVGQHNYHWSDEGTKSRYYDKERRHLKSISNCCFPRVVIFVMCFLGCMHPASRKSTSHGLVTLFGGAICSISNVYDEIVFKDKLVRRNTS